MGRLERDILKKGEKEIDMKTIMVILTGGTIGSQIQKKEHQIKCGKIDVSETLFGEWMDSESLTIYQPVNLLSENETPAVWREVSAFIHERYNEKSWDGILITHGSDTLPYFAAAMGILCSDLNLPVVVTAANYSLEDPRSNGQVNVRGCMDYLMDDPEAGTVVIYQNPEEDTKIYDAFQLREADHENDHFSSYGECYGRVENRQVVCTSDLEGRLSHVRTIYEELKRNQVLASGKEVLCLKPVPGLHYDSFLVDEGKIGAVLHDTYHSGTACTEGEKENLLLFQERLKKKRIPLFLTGLKSNVDNQYETTAKLIQNGAFELKDCTFETSYVVLVLASF